MAIASNGLNNAAPFKWTYADATARTSDTGFVADDVGKLAFQESDNTLWILTATTPTWQAAAGGGTGDMLSTNNLSDVANVATARTNLGLGTAATHDVPASGDATATQVPLGNDSRLSDARTPTAHATSHESGGSDAFTGIVPGSAFAPAGLTGATAASRYVGATASGAPASGTFAVGDFVIDQTGTIWVCTTAGSPGAWTQISGGGGGGGAPTTANYVTTAADATLTAEIAIPGLAGSADRAGIGGSTFAEEFDTTTLPLTWTASNPASQDSNTTIPSALYLHGTDATERYGYRAFSPAGAFDLRAKVSVGLTGGGGSPLVQCGLVAADATNANRAFVQLSMPSLAQPSLFAYSVAAGVFTQRATVTYGSTSVYLRVTRDGSNNFAWYYSSDGLTWIILAALAFTFTVTQAGLRLSAAGTSPTYDAAIDWIRAS